MGRVQEYYAGVIKDCTIGKVTDVDSYLGLLNDCRYWVFIAVKDEASRYLDEEMAGKLRALGLEAMVKGQNRCSYYGILVDGQVKEQAGYERLKETGTMRGGRSVHDVVSAGYECGKEYMKNQRGLNIVIYNHVTKTVVDSVCFDTYEEGSPARR